MEKKIYVMPSIKEVRVENQPILAGSPQEKVNAEIEGEDTGLEWGGTTKPDETYSPD